MPVVTNAMQQNTAMAIICQSCRAKWPALAAAVLCCMALVTAGIAVSYPLDLPSGPVIILIAGVAYLLATSVAAMRRR